MLLNKLIVSEKGFVALLEVTGNGKTLQSIQDEYFKTKYSLRLLELSTASLIIKCPLFVQLNISQCGLSVISTPTKEVEAYVPDLSEIAGNSLEDRQEMANYISITTEALLLNQKGLPMDGADAFTAQLLTPISLYSEIIVSGSLRQWITFLNQKTLPQQVSIYQVQAQNVIRNEWKNIEELKKMLK
jgi:hypothetical protein